MFAIWNILLSFGIFWVLRLEIERPNVERANVERPNVEFYNIDPKLSDPKSNIERRTKPEAPRGLNQGPNLT
jgi:hypothetical protein